MEYKLTGRRAILRYLRSDFTNTTDHEKGLHKVSGPQDQCWPGCHQIEVISTMVYRGIGTLHAISYTHQAIRRCICWADLWIGWGATEADTRNGEAQWS